VRENGLGLVLKSLRELRPAAVELIDRLPELRARAKLIDNRALFEVPEIFAGLLRAAAQPVPLDRHRSVTFPRQDSPESAR
jgi:hypothetical protein